MERRSFYLSCRARMLARTVFVLLAALLTAAGAVLGGLAGVLLEGGLSGGALIRAGAGLAVFWAGAAAAVGSMTRVNVMKLMRTEE